MRTFLRYESERETGAFRKSELSSAVLPCERPLTLSQARSAEWFAETRALGATPLDLVVYCFLHLRQYLRLTVHSTFSVTTVTRS